jgi:hypothetical protein
MELDDDDLYDQIGLGVDCNYHDLASINNIQFPNSIMHLNIRSLSPKIDELEALINLVGSPKVLMLSETWLNNVSVSYNVSNYSFVSSPRLRGRGGGVAMFVNNLLHYVIKDRLCDHTDNNNIDYLLIELPKVNIMLCCMYCPPNTRLDHIIALLERNKAFSNPRTLFIAGGDYNINLLDESSDISVDFLDNIHSLGLSHVITLPTRVTDVSATLLDNFLCDVNILPVCTSVIKTDISDHFLIELSLKTRIIAKTITKRDFCNKNQVNFTSKLCATNWDPLYLINDANLAFNYFIKKIKRIYNKSFPFKILTWHSRRNPWLTSGILKSIRHKNALFLKSKANPIFANEYKTYRNHLTCLIRDAKRNYHKQLLTALRNKSTKLWSHLKTLISPIKINDIPLSAEVLNNFFTSVFKQAPNNQLNQCHTIPNNDFVNCSMFLTPVSANEVLYTLHSLSNSQSLGADGLLPDIIKNNALHINSHLAHICNLSFLQGVFPNLLKKAIVVPIYKNGSRSDPSNYRPISILSTFSKVFEKLFHSRLVAFINKNNILHTNQFGFRSGKSTSLALTHVLSSLLAKCNSHSKVILTLLDLKKAFDFINHDLLLVKLKHYGIRGTPLQWIASYLTNRSQKCRVNANLSEMQSISAGVPQGSILGPILFIIFINDVFQFSSVNIELYLYADDTAIIFTADNNTDLQTIVDDFFVKYVNWCTMNCIVVNPLKSNFLSFNHTNVVVSINGHVLENPHFVKYLGILIDDKLSWNNHVKYVTKLCCQRIGVFKKILFHLPNDVAILYYNAFIQPCFSYCTVFWFNNVHTTKQRLVDKIDKVIFILANMYKLTSHEFVNCMHVYDVCKIFKLQSVSLMYDVYKGQSNFEFICMILNKNIHDHFTRGNTNVHISNTSSLDNRNFIYHGILNWNNCPVHLRLLPKHMFLSQYKRLLFSDA